MMDRIEKLFDEDAPSPPFGVLCGFCLQYLHDLYRWHHLLQRIDAKLVWQEFQADQAARGHRSSDYVEDVNRASEWALALTTVSTERSSGMAYGDRRAIFNTPGFS